MNPPGRFAAELSADGGRVGSLRLDGTELLVQGDQPLTCGVFPMVPWAGRLDRGLLRFADTEFQLPIDLGKHAIHGTGYTSKWSEIAPDHFELDLDEPWPFGGTVTHRCTVRPDRVRLELTVTAAGLPMPVQVGWHPWFRRSVGSGRPLEVTVAPARMYEIDTDAIPTGKLVEPSRPPWDNCFVGMAMSPRLTQPGLATIELRSSCDHWVIFDQSDHAVCVEPQTGPPNGLNTDAHILHAGAELRAWFELVVVEQSQRH